MRTTLGIGAVMLGLVGLLLCASAVGLGWWTATRSIDRIRRAAARLDRGLSEADARLARIESLLNAVRLDLNEVRGAIETIVAENPELPRIRAEIDRLVDRLDSAVDRAETIGDALRAGATGLRTAADIVDQLNDDPIATARVRNAADKVDRAAESLNGLRARIKAAKSVRAVQWTRELVALARGAIAGSERLAEGLAAARQELVVVRERTAERRDQVVWWICFAATANALVCLWGGLGQVCLIGWGRRRFERRAVGG